MIVDTGADYTLLPRYESENLGINLETECHPFLTEGVGGSETMYLLKRCRVKLGERELFIPLGFLDRDNIPPLPGRQDFLETFRMTMDQHVTTFDLQEMRNLWIRDNADIDFAIAHPVRKVGAIATESPVRSAPAIPQRDWRRAAPFPKLLQSRRARHPSPLIPHVPALAHATMGAAAQSRGAVQRPVRA